MRYQTRTVNAEDMTSDTLRESFVLDNDVHLASAYDRLADPRRTFILIAGRGYGKTHLIRFLQSQLELKGHKFLRINDVYSQAISNYKHLKAQYPLEQEERLWMVAILEDAIGELIKKDSIQGLLSQFVTRLRGFGDITLTFDKTLQKLQITEYTEFDIHQKSRLLNKALWEILQSSKKIKPQKRASEEERYLAVLPDRPGIYIFVDNINELSETATKDDLVGLISAIKTLNQNAISHLGEEVNFKILMAIDLAVWEDFAGNINDISQLHGHIDQLIWSKESIRLLIARRILSDNEKTELTSQNINDAIQKIFPGNFYYFGRMFDSSVDFILEITMLTPRQILLFWDECIQAGNYQSALRVEDVVSGFKSYSRLRLVDISNEYNILFPEISNLMNYLAIHRDEINRKVDRSFLEKLFVDYLSETYPNTDKPKWLHKTEGILETLYYIGVIGVPTNTYTGFYWQDNVKYAFEDRDVSIKSYDHFYIHPSLWYPLTNIRKEILLKRRHALYLYDSLRTVCNQLSDVLHTAIADGKLFEGIEINLGRFLAITKLIQEQNDWAETADYQIAENLVNKITSALKYFALTPLYPDVPQGNREAAIFLASHFYSKTVLAYIPQYGHDKVVFTDYNTFVQKKIQNSSLYSDINVTWLNKDELSFNEEKELENFRNILSVGADSLAAVISQSIDSLQQFIDVPPEVLNKLSGTQSVINFFSIALEGEIINEAKVLIVGQGSVGKSSIINRLIYDRFDIYEAKTEGISIQRWQVNDLEIPTTENAPSIIQLNIWDFGGQEIMHATHRFFFTKRSLYLLVIDARNSEEQNQIEYWLKLIQSFSEKSPVLIVGNKIDQHPLDIDSTGLQKKYPNIVGFLETSAATGAGIEELKTTIAEQVNDLPHVHDRLPETWFAVKTKLEELGRLSNFITHDKYLELCAENEISDEISQRTLISFLHDLGVVLHFQDDPRLEALGILNPQWVTNGVYKILNSHTLFQNKGVLTTSMLDEILNLPEYPRGKRLFIVDMMKKFELCYEIEPDKTFLVPDLLPKDQPDLKFNGVPAFEYAYPVLPSSVITRFIVRMNQKIDDGLVWRTGVVLKIGDNKALVKADIEDRKITTAIDGVEHTRRDALSAIRFQLDEIHASIKGLDAQKRVPIPEAPEAEPLDYDYLLQLERDGFEEHPVKNGNRLVKVNVRKLLSGVVSEAERRQTGGNITNIFISGDVKDSNIIAGDENETSR